MDSRILEFPRLKLFLPISRETGISREFPARGFLLNIPAIVAKARDDDADFIIREVHGLDHVYRKM